MFKIIYTPTGDVRSEHSTMESVNLALSVFETDPDETRPIEEVIKEAWRGLLCDSGGLRSITEIKEI